LARANFILALGAWAALAGSAAALECPRPQPLAKPGVLAETPGDIAILSTALVAGHDPQKIREIVDGLRQEHPGVEPAEIMNYLIAAYCPVAAKAAGLTEAQRQTMVDQFVIEARSLVY
jgi:hypothetical protein